MIAKTKEKTKKQKKNTDQTDNGELNLARGTNLKKIYLGGDFADDDRKFSFRRSR
jgi:hypothetical protein